MKRDQGTREQIINVAVRLFGTKGYKQTGMGEIAKEVGISKPAIYYHFESKEKLFRAILKIAEEKHDELFKDIADRNLEFPDFVEEFIRQMIRELRDLTDWFHMFNRLFFTSEVPEFIDIRKHHEADRRRFRDLVLPSLRGYRFRPGVDFDDFINFFLCVIGSLIAEWLIMDEFPDESTAPQKLRDMILFGAFERIAP